MPAKEVLAMWHWDHLVAHSLGGPDGWHNLDPKLADAHREKTRKTDIPAIAKVKRNEKVWGPFMTAINAGVKPAKRQAKTKWPKRSFPKKSGGTRNGFRR